MQRKIEDYRCVDYPERLRQMIARVPALVEGAPFRQEMWRFLPQEVLERTLGKPKFSAFLAQELVALLQELQTALPA